MATRPLPTIKIALKPGVVWNHMTLQAILALYFLGYLYDQEGEDTLTVTSLHDGQHMEGSKHYTGEALDIRLPKTNDPEAIAAKARTFLGPDFDVVVEPTHIHVEHDPKEPKRRK